MNYPGSWHDSSIANESGFISKSLANTFTPMGKAEICDSAVVVFAPSLKGKYVMARKVTETRDLGKSEVTECIGHSYSENSTK